MRAAGESLDLAVPVEYSAVVDAGRERLDLGARTAGPIQEERQNTGEQGDRAEPQQPGSEPDRRLEQHEIPVAPDQILLDLGVGPAGGDLFADQLAHVGGDDGGVLSLMDRRLRLGVGQRKAAA